MDESWPPQNPPTPPPGFLKRTRQPWTEFLPIHPEIRALPVVNHRIQREVLQDWGEGRLTRNEALERLGEDRQEGGDVLLVRQGDSFTQVAADLHKPGGARPEQPPSGGLHG